jgi:predicted RNase H-like HicB family nuclease
MAFPKEYDFEFTSAVLKDGEQFVSLCLDLDVASQGASLEEAKKMLAEAVTLYLEGCFESNIPYLRPVPREEDPRFNPTPGLLSIFPLKVEFKVHAFA